MSIYKKFNDEKILNPPKLSLFFKQQHMPGSTRTLNEKELVTTNANTATSIPTIATPATLRRINSKLARNRTSQSELSLNQRQRSLNQQQQISLVRIFFNIFIRIESE